MNNTREQLPDWFDGMAYEIGDTVRNPFTEVEVELDAAELSMYDLIKGAEVAIHMGFGDQKDCLNIMQKGTSWFRKKNPEAYMDLLD